MREFPVTGFSASKLTGLIARQEEAILYAGNPPICRVYLLPLSKWGDRIEETYKVSNPTRLSVSQLSAGVVMKIVDSQVGADWSPACYIVLTLNDSPVAYVVPANAHWREALGQ